MAQRIELHWTMLQLFDEQFPIPDDGGKCVGSLRIQGTSYALRRCSVAATARMIRPFAHKTGNIGRADAFHDTTDTQGSQARSKMA